MGEIVIVYRRYIFLYHGHSCICVLLVDGILDKNHARH
jgi:hypothetical protein